jgi:hypothetical protein
MKQLSEKPDGKRKFGRSERRKKENIKIRLKIRYRNVDLIHLAEPKNQ